MPGVTSNWNLKRKQHHVSQSTHRLRHVAALLVVAITATGILEASDHPSIVVILADDMGFGDPGCNNPDLKIETPNINRIASEGLRFTDAHSPASWCTPTRYGLLTGRYPFGHHSIGIRSRSSKRVA